MSWEWSKFDEKGLARYVLRDAVNSLRLPLNRFDLVQQPNGLRLLIEAIYDALVEKHIRYVHEVYQPDEAIQTIRNPLEILQSPGEGTCLDLATLFCGLCLGFGLLPTLIIVEGHALAAVSLIHQLEQWNDIADERSVFKSSLLQSPDILLSLIRSGSYVAVECTGFAHSDTLSRSTIEGQNRVGGYMTSNDAIMAGCQQLEDDKRFRFAFDVAIAQNEWGFRPVQALGQEEPRTYGIRQTFNLHTNHALRKSKPHIKGLSEIISRDESRQIQERLCQNESILVIGESGTGKSGIFHYLMTWAQGTGQSLLAIDARSLQSISSEGDLRRHYSLNEHSLASACKLLAEVASSTWKLQTNDHRPPFLLLIDQLDSVVGSPASIHLIDFALDCQDSSLVQVVVLSRSHETEEEQLLKDLYDRGFVEIRCEELIDAVPYLEEMGITKPTEGLANMARNLLNLSLIGAIQEQNPSWDHNGILTDVALWDQYLDTLSSQESNGDLIIAEVTKLAKQALSSSEGTFIIPSPISREHRRLLSWRFIKRQGRLRVGTFVHENMQDFLYAKNAIEEGKTKEQVSDELPFLRTQNILLWMDKIAEVYNVPGRGNLLRSFFDG